jgi:hypothetical protein
MGVIRMEIELIEVAVTMRDAMGGAEDILSIVADVNRWSAPCRS